MQDEIVIESLRNFPVDSNCYIVKKQHADKCVIVDPAQGNGSELHRYLLDKKIKPDYIILTHEHFDHISSIEYLRKEFGCKLIATRACSEKITHPKKNLSLFYDQVGFACEPADILIEKNNFYFDWSGTGICFYITPGHSEGGLCFSIGDHLFTGDTLMQHYKPIVKLPGGNKGKLIESIKMLFREFDKTTIVFPGHGEPFQLSQISILSIIDEK